jgi:hypothetical protein
LSFFKQIVRGLTIIYALVFNFTLKCINFHTRVCVCVCEALWWLKITFWKVEPIILPTCACQGKRLTVEKNWRNVILVDAIICNYWQGFNNHSSRRLKKQEAYAFNYFGLPRGCYSFKYGTTAGLENECCRFSVY